MNEGNWRAGKERTNQLTCFQTLKASPAFGQSEQIVVPFPVTGPKVWAIAAFDNADLRPPPRKPALDPKDGLITTDTLNSLGRTIRFPLV
jgi:hypothetical protein